MFGDGMAPAPIAASSCAAIGSSHAASSSGAASDHPGPPACDHPGPPADSTGGHVVDAMWSKYAIAHLKETASDSDAEVYSLGPHLTHSLDFFCQSLQEVYEGGAAVASKETLMQFDFQSEACSDTYRSALPGLDEDCIAGDDNDIGSVFFFTIAKHNPQNARLPTLAASVQGGDKLAISTVDIVRIDPHARIAEVDLDGPASHELQILSPSMCSLEELSTLRGWRLSGEMTYHCGVTFPEHLQGAAPAVLKGLMAASTIHGKSFTVLDSDVEQFDKLEVLDALVARGRVEQDATCRATWRLTPAGCSSLRVAHKLAGGEVALRIRDGITTDDASVFELMSMLANQGWRGAVHEATGKRKRHSPYTLGQLRLWFHAFDFGTMLRSQLACCSSSWL